MVYLISHSTDPFWNLALEKYLLEVTQVDIVVLYINQASVVVGKNQNIWQEANLSLAHKEGIILARRISGGGAVYHDLGNLNYAVIQSVRQQTRDYHTVLNHVTQYLGQYVHSLYIGKHHAVYFRNKKISGSAKAVKRDRALQHGTLLYNTNLELLHQVLSKQSTHIQQSRGIPSNPAETVNISPALPFASIRELIESIALYLASLGAKEYRLDSQGIQTTKEYRKMLASPEWVFGKNPSYTISGTSSAGKSFAIQVKKGVMVHFEGVEKKLMEKLSGRYHNPETLRLLDEEGSLANCERNALM